MILFLRNSAVFAKCSKKKNREAYKENAEAKLGLAAGWEALYGPRHEPD